MTSWWRNASGQPASRPAALIEHALEELLRHKDQKEDTRTEGEGPLGRRSERLAQMSAEHGTVLSDFTVLHLRLLDFCSEECFGTIISRVWRARQTQRVNRGLASDDKIDV